MRNLNVRKILGPHAAILCLLGLATVFYFSREHARILGSDEVYSLLDARSLGTQNLLLRPAYYLVLRAWMSISQATPWLRGLSICFALGSVFMTYCLASFSLGRRFGLAPAALLLLSVVFQNHADEIRMYSMGTFLTVAGSYALARALVSRRTFPLSAWAACRLVGILTIPLTATLFAPDVFLICRAFRADRRLLRAAGLRLGLVVVLCAPSLLLMERESARFFADWVSNIPHPSLLTALDLPCCLFTFGTLPGASAAIQWLLVLPGLAMIAVAFARIREKKAAGLVAIAAWGLIPYGILVLYSATLGNLWVPRYYLFLQPYFVILIAAGICALGLEAGFKGRALAVAIGAAYIGMSVLNFQHPEYVVNRGYHWYDASESIREGERAGDVVVILAADPARYAEVLKSYYHGASPVLAPEELGQAAGGGARWRLGRESLEKFFSGPVNSDARIWLVVRRGGLTADDLRLLDQVLERHFHIQSRRQFLQVSVLLLKR